MMEQQQSPKRISKAREFTEEEAAALSDKERYEAAAATDVAAGVPEPERARDYDCHFEEWKEHYQRCRAIGWSSAD